MKLITKSTSIKSSIEFYSTSYRVEPTHRIFRVKIFFFKIMVEKVTYQHKFKAQIHKAKETTMGITFLSFFQRIYMNRKYNCLLYPWYELYMSIFFLVFYCALLGVSSLNPLLIEGER